MGTINCNPLPQANFTEVANSIYSQETFKLSRTQGNNTIHLDLTCLKPERKSLVHK